VCACVCLFHNEEKVKIAVRKWLKMQESYF